MLESRLAAAAAAAVTAGTAFYLWFFEVEPGALGDELNLANPVYMARHTGRTTFPIYGYPHSMVVHPPTHYWLLAQLMSITGGRIEVAALVPVIFWVAVASFLTARSRWTLATKAAVLSAIWLAIVVWAYPSYIRPDVHIAAAWVAGLVALETGRLGNWHWPRLAVGSLALAIAATLHYPASLSAVGVLPYAMWLLSTPQGRRSWRAIAALVVPALGVLLLYALIFVLPHLHEIRSFTTQLNVEGPRAAKGLFGAFEQTREQYHLFYLHRLGQPGSFVPTLMYPLFRFGIPSVLVSVPLLALRRETRGLAVGSLPFLLTLLLYARAKTVFYYAPDVFIYFAATGALAFAGIRLAAERMLRHRPAEGVVLASLLTVAVVGAVIAVPAPAVARTGAFTWHPLHRDVDVARAAGADMLQPNALLATNDLNLWYVSGSTNVFYPRDFDQILSLRGLNVRGYVRGFDAFAVSTFDSWTTVNAEHQTISTFYARGLLHVRGFYFGHSRVGGQSTRLKYLLLSARREPLTGYAWNGRSILRFESSASGPYIFATLLCPANKAAVEGTSWQTAIPLPGAVAADEPSRRVIRAFVAPRTVVGRALGTARREGCRVRSEQSMRATAEPVRSFLRQWDSGRVSKKLIRFPVAVNATAALYAPAMPVHLVERVRLARLMPFGATKIDRRRRGVGFISSPTRYSTILELPLALPATVRPVYIRVRTRIDGGMVRLCALDLRRNTCGASQFLGRTRAGFQFVYLPVRDLRHVALYVDNEQDQVSRLVVLDVELLAARRR